MLVSDGLDDNEINQQRTSDILHIHNTILDVSIFQGVPLDRCEVPSSVCQLTANTLKKDYCSQLPIYSFPITPKKDSKDFVIHLLHAYAPKYISTIRLFDEFIQSKPD